MRNQYDRDGEVLAHQHLLDSFVTFVSLNRSAATQDQYKNKCRLLIRAWDAVPPAEWTKMRFETFIATGKAGKLPGQITAWGPRSVQIILIASKLFGEFLRSHDVPCPEFWVSVKKPRLIVKEAKFFTLEQGRRLLESAHGTPYFPRIALGLGAGLRRAEMQRARWEDVDFATHTITVHRSKVGMSHRIPMSPFLETALLTIKKDSGPVVEGGLSNSTRDLQAICAAAGIKYASLHALRHGFATEMLARGVPVNVVAKIGGWSSLKVLQRYAHVMDGAMKEGLAVMTS